MNPTEYLMHMDGLPPFVLCALAKTLDGKPISLRLMERLTGWNRNTVIRCCRSTSWADWTIQDIIHFHRVLNMTPRRVSLIRSACMSGRLDLSHIKVPKTKREITARLAGLFRKMIKEKAA